MMCTSNTGWSFNSRTWECARYQVLQNVRFGGFGFAMNQSETDFKFNCKVKVDTEPVWTGEIDTSLCERLRFGENPEFGVFNVDLCRLFEIRPILIN